MSKSIRVPRESWFPLNLPYGDVVDEVDNALAEG